MPQISGRELAEKARELRPDARVLFMSGFTDDAVVRHGIVADDVCFIQKPFSPEGLARKAREVLEGGNGQSSAPKASFEVRNNAERRSQTPAQSSALGKPTPSIDEL